MENKQLIIVMKGKTYQIDFWEIKYDNKKKRYIITGEDYNGMFYQLIFKEIKNIKYKLYKIILKVE